MPIGRERTKVLYRILSKRKGHHFYSVMRWLIAVGFTVGVALLPLTDTLRFDFWRGRHMLLGREMGLVEAARAFAFPFLAINIGIILVTRFLGRYLCGFVCPVGALARVSEWTRFRGKHRSWRYLGPLLVLLICLILAAITFSFWVDWRVFSEGSRLAKSIAAAFLAAMALGLYAIVYGLGLGFCRSWCPSGVYFAVLGHRTFNGIEFAHPEECTHCKACERVCPSDLQPTRMAGGDYREGSGFYSDGRSNFALCLRCGDCVIACQGVTSHKTDKTPLRMGWLPEAAREYRDGVLEAEGGPALPMVGQEANPDKAGVSQREGEVSWKAERA